MTTHEKYVPELTEEELDSMLAQWADTELDVPEGFHESVMMRLRAEESKQTQTVQALQQKGKIVSLAERFANKKVWISTIVAAALVVCCLPVLQERQDYLAGIENSDVQAYEMRSRIVENDDEMSEEPVMVNAMLVDAQASPAANGTMNDAADVNGAMEKFAILSQDSYSYTFDESRADLTVEETLKLAQDNLSELEAHLAALDDTAENDALREELQNKIEELKAEIIVLEEQINTKE
ncbi:MAG: hypothetical protein IIX24_01965 [Peptococcaceae bacterium]|nr:hypothetical protein [Peptococcaceae bacterium]